MAGVSIEKGGGWSGRREEIDRRGRERRHWHFVIRMVFKDIFQPRKMVVYSLSTQVRELHLQLIWTKIATAHFSRKNTWSSVMCFLFIFIF